MPYTIGIDARKLRDFGIGTYVRNLVEALGRIDHENQYVLFVGKATPDRLPPNFQLVVERSPLYSLRELMALSWRLLRLRLDLYHATHYVLPSLVPCRAVVTIHDIIHLLYPEFLPNRLAFLYAQRMIRRSLTRGARIIAVSQNTKADLMDYFDVDGRKIRVIYNGVEDAFRRPVPAAERELWRRRLDLPAEYLLFVGNPKPHKNLPNVLRAFARAHASHGVTASLVCVGARSGTDFKLRQLAEQLGIAARLRLVGEVPQEALPAIYQGASLFLYPTLYEGFGLPVIEAMAAGVPVVTSNGSALREIAEGYAHLVDPLDVAAMTAAIVRCLTDQTHREELIQLGRKRAADFDWDQAAEKTREVYLAALRSKEPTSTGSVDLGRTGEFRRKVS